MENSVKDYIIGPRDAILFQSDINNLNLPPNEIPSSNAEIVTINRTSEDITIYEKIKNQITVLEDEKKNIHERKRKLEEMKVERANCTKRYQIKLKRKFDEMIACESEQIKEIESGKRVDDFKRSVEPYVQAFQQQQFCRPRQFSIENVGRTQNERSKASQIIHEYTVNIEGGVPKFQIESKDTCEKCKQHMSLHTTTSMMVCANCGIATPFLDATAALLSFSDDSYEYCSFSYKRINHFSEWIASMQAKESTDIPQSVLDIIMERLRDERIHDTSQITLQKIREILKRFRLRKYYEHVQLIHNKITNEPPPRLTPDQEEKIKLLFMAASSAFSRVCPSDRRNFVSYSFIIQKLCRLLDYKEFQNVTPGLKGRQKVERQNSIWKAICDDLNWDYAASMAS